MKENKLRTKMLVADRIVLSDAVENEAILLTEQPRQAVLKTEAFCLIRNSGYVLLDFGVEFQGGVHITVQMISAPNVKLRVVFGESVSEALSEIGDKNAGNYHSVRDETISVVSRSSFRVGNTGFRFVKLEARGGDIEVRGVQGVFEFRNIEYNGSFCCSDDLLNKIWKMAVYTVHLNMQEYLWDGIKRDRLVWIGDMHPEVSAICCAFGFDECVPESLDLIRNETPEEGWMNDIPAYSMWWIIIQRDWYFQNGDLEYLRRQKDYLFALLKRILGSCKNDTELNPFVDWSSVNTKYARAGLRAMTVLALDAGSELCRILENPQLAEDCVAAVSILKKEKLEYDGNKQIAAFVSLAGLGPVRKINDEILAVNGAEGISAFLGYYTLQAMAEAGDMEGALNIIREYWGKMIELGATTFWEEFETGWAENAGRIDEVVPEGKRDIHGDFGRNCYKQFRRSLCHGWSGGPAPFLSNYVLGVRIEGPGCKKIRIDPMPGNLKWVKGTYPTPNGKIEIAHFYGTNGELFTNVTAPGEIEIVCSTKNFNLRRSC